jgi:hypothetical protein
MIPYARGQIVQLVEKPGYLQGVSRGNEYVITRVGKSHGAIYLTVLGEDDHAHSLLATMFRLVARS